MSEYTQRDWQNGKPCPPHTMPYCTPCFKALVSLTSANPYKTMYQAQDDMQAGFDALRENIVRSMMGRENSMQQDLFYRPKTRNFFLDSRRRKFAASCQLANENFLVVPLEFVYIGDEETVHKADDDETRAILTKEHLWDISTPEWMQQDVTLQLDDEDSVLLREFQLFKS
jgi:hypothetical protein